jgi:TRAP-type C4-dicarboxylate transport system permease small subunit
VSKGSPSDEIGNYFAAHPLLIGVVVVAIFLIVYFVWPRMRRRVVQKWKKAKQGAAIFRDRRRYAREVALPSTVSYACRMGMTAVFMAAFDLPVTLFTVFLKSRRKQVVA